MKDDGALIAALMGGVIFVFPYIKGGVYFHGGCGLHSVCKM